jgi:hypothetical protein
MLGFQGVTSGEERGGNLTGEVIVGTYEGCRSGLQPLKIVWLSRTQAVGFGWYLDAPSVLVFTAAPNLVTVNGIASVSPGHFVLRRYIDTAEDQAPRSTAWAVLSAQKKPSLCRVARISAVSTGNPLCETL